MAFTSTEKKRGVIGDVQYRSVTYDSTGATSGTVTVDLDKLYGVAVAHDTDEVVVFALTDVVGASTVALSSITDGSTGTLFIVGR